MSTNKSFSTEASERYSRALFEVAKEEKNLDKIESDIKNFQVFFAFFKKHLLHYAHSVDEDNTMDDDEDTPTHGDTMH